MLAKITCILLGLLSEGRGPTKVPNYNEKLRSSVTVQEFFFASFEFSPSEFKRSNASTSTDYIWSRPVHCSRAPWLDFSESEDEDEVVNRPQPDTLKVEFKAYR